MRASLDSVSRSQSLHPRGSRVLVRTPRWYALSITVGKPSTGYVMDTASGARLDLDHPGPEYIRIKDVADGLSGVCHMGAQARVLLRGPACADHLRVDLGSRLSRSCTSRPTSRFARGLPLRHAQTSQAQGCLGDRCPPQTHLAMWRARTQPRWGTGARRTTRPSAETSASASRPEAAAARRASGPPSPRAASKTRSVRRGG
jgi:hypothetical protein